MKLEDLLNLFEDLYNNWGYLIVFVSSFLEMSPFGWLIPGGTLVIIAGFFSYPDIDRLITTIIFAVLGGFLSLLLAYYVGNKSGYKLIKKYKKEKVAKRSENILNNQGPVILLTSMLGGLTRFWISYVAGTLKYSFKSFAFYAFVTATIWMSVMASLGYLAGTQKDKLETFITQLGIVSWIFVIMAIVIVYFVNKKQYEKEKS